MTRWQMGFVTFLFGFTATSARAAEERAGLQFAEAVVVERFNKAEPLFDVSGFLPSGCHAWDGVEVERVNSRHHIVRGFSSRILTNCSFETVPFKKQIGIGALDLGSHKIVFENTDGPSVELEFFVDL